MIADGGTKTAGLLSSTSSPSSMRRHDGRRQLHGRRQLRLVDA
jgi:hypothetical protein